MTSLLCRSKLVPTSTNHTTASRLLTESFSRCNRPGATPDRYVIYSNTLPTTSGGLLPIHVCSAIRAAQNKTKQNAHDERKPTQNTKSGRLPPIHVYSTIRAGCHLFQYIAHDELHKTNAQDEQHKTKVLTTGGRLPPIHVCSTSHIKINAMSLDVSLCSSGPNQR